MTWDMGMYIEEDRLGHFAENTARELAPSRRAGCAALSRAARGRLAKLRECCASLAGAGWGPEGPPDAARWLLDNRYLAAREGEAALAELKRAGRLPGLSGAEGNIPAAAELARALLRAGGGELTLRRLDIFLEGGRKARALEERELYLFPCFLRLAAAEGAARAAEETLAALDGRGGEKRLAALGELCRRLFTTLRLLSGADLTELLEAHSAVEALLRRDPAGVYPLMDEESRADYRFAVSRLAKKRGLSEAETAGRALELALASQGRERHIGYYIIEDPLGGGRDGVRAGEYVWPLALGTAALAALVWALTKSPLAAALAAGPVFHALKAAADHFILRALPRRHIPALDLKDGVPDRGRTLCVISALLTDPGSGPALARSLEEFALLSRSCGRNLLFGLLCDLPDASAPLLPGDLETLEAARRAVAELDRRRGGFFFITRPRSYNEKDGVWSGRERKRGAVAALMELLAGRPSGLTAEGGGSLKGVRFVITLDADTRLTCGAASKLIGAMLHPLNRPVVSGGRVIRGHGIIQPAVEVELGSAMRTRFSRAFAGQGGLDPYAGARGEVYQDLFGRGSFTGKGIIDAEAFFLCLTETFPENRVLSHDLLEGEYLGAGLMTRAELTDGFPASVSSYYTRLHRWIRGDWQAAAWLRRRAPTRRGRMPNPLDGLARFKIFDNLRRSLTPALILAAWLAAIFTRSPAMNAAGLIALGCFLAELPLALAERGLSGRPGRQRLASGIAVGPAEIFRRCFLSAALLPFEALLSLGAALTALFRLHVTGRRLLDWTTASQSDKRPVAYFRRMLPAMALGAVCLGLSPHPLGAAAGAVWLLSPLICLFLDLPGPGPRPLSSADRDFLLSEARQMWGYFEDNLTAENNWLPPDNVQLLPDRGAAARTSPTNMGMALLSTAAAFDLGFISAGRLLELAERQLGSLEKLEKWRGHPYNWYSTTDLSPLRPRVVSFVDSGNLAGCLIACAKTLEELGLPEAAALAERCEKLWRGIDLACLYNAKKRLFHLSADPDTGRLSEGFYDLLESEARLASYIASATGQADARHWAALGRAQLRYGKMQGMASWTGTMFEYLMPDLLLPRFEGSFLSESALFCAAAQRGRVKRGQVWGVSESAFALLDESLCYRYKASGVQALGLKTGLDRDLVISPYSSFLALSAAPAAAVENLRRLRKLGLGGKYGLCEAADFTPSRLCGPAPFETVACFMAHHLGMSLAAADNALRDGILRRRFMSQPEMGAFSELLKERIPVDSPVMAPFYQDAPEPSRRRAPLYCETFREAEPSARRCAPLTNGSFHIAAFDGGQTREVCRGRTLLRFGGGAPGMGVWFWSGEKLFPLIPMGGEKSPGFGWSAAGDRIVWESTGGGFAARLTLAALAGADASLRTVEIENLSRRPLEGQVIFAAEPVLAEDAAYAAHPAYSKLFIETDIQDNAVIFRRRGEDAAMAFAVAGAELQADTCRRRAFGRGGVWGSRPGEEPWGGLRRALLRPAGGTRGEVTDPCLLARCPVKIQPGERAAVKAALAFGGGGEALGAALRACRACEKEFSPKAGLDAALLGLEGGELETAFRALAALTLPPAAPLIQGRELLWRHGVSAALPIIAHRAEPGADGGSLSRSVRRFLWLKNCGVRADLLFLVRDEPGYRQPVRDRASEAVGRLGGEGFLGKNGGIHILAGLSPEDTQALLAFACFSGEGEPPARSAPRPGAISARLVGSERPAPPVCAFTEKGGWRMELRGELPPRVRSHVLASPSFGAVMAETGCFALWRGNARENKLLPWVNDPLAVSDGLDLRLETAEGEASLFAAEDGFECYVNYYPGWALWEKRLPAGTVIAAVFAARSADALVVIVSGAPGRVVAAPEIVMGADRDEGRFVAQAPSDGPFKCYVNNFSSEFNPQTLMAAASRATRGDRIFLIGCARDPLSAAKIRALFQPEAARRELAAVKEYWGALCSRVRVRSPWRDFDNYVNQWAPYQIIACRLFARCGVYQCGGAYGFRDQLQDVCALLPIARSLAEKQILRCCANQFTQGDAAHWWHETDKGRRGVRTNYSDDLLWLPYAAALWAKSTGDRSLLEKSVPYLEAEPLAPGQHDRYFAFTPSALSEPVLLHCKRALDLALRRGAGEHGLAKILGGDWNDGMNLVGAEGRGESLWLTCLLILSLEGCAPLFQRAGIDPAPYLSAAEKYRAAVEAAFDKDRFIRGYFDSGAVIGAPGGRECAMDAISQSFAALVLKGDRPRSAVSAAIDALFDPRRRIVKLFHPPFNGDGPDPGYIRRYPPGIRENGGQYTHGAVWLALGAFEAGLEDRAAELMLALLPGGREDGEYLAEPYVLCGDVYSGANAGMGGWSWYTGAAGWYWRTALERMAGLKMENGAVFRRGGDSRVELEFDGRALEEGMALQVSPPGDEAGEPGDGNSFFTVKNL